tara:strand:- start:270 stop:1022 length:753 start_codon:yes stop_codon:yes gene_type:complete
MRIISYNINGIRAGIKKGILEWLKKENPDVICFQEIKANSNQFDTIEFEKLGYHCYWHSAQKKGYSGVAILTKLKPKKITYGCGEKIFDNEGRVLKIDLDKVSVMSCYFPSGTTGGIRQKFKMDFLHYFYEFIKLQTTNLIVCGDYNICHKSIDIHNPIANKSSSGFLPEERDWITAFLKLGFIDTFRYVNPNPDNYSWWSYRANARNNNKGWRIDYNMLSKNLKTSIKDARIMKDVYYSDHCPILLEIT